MTLWTPMRCAVAACLIDGMTEREAAAAIGCHRSPVQYHIRALLAATEARNHRHLAAILGAMPAASVGFVQ